MTRAAARDLPADTQLDDERRRALRALLLHPLVSASGPHAPAHTLVRRHAEHLRAWLSRHTGWSLLIDSEVARLRKTVEGDDGTRPAVNASSRLPFSRRRYVLLCLALAALERCERQTTLGRLAEQVGELVRGDPELTAAGMTWDLASRDARRDLVHAVRLLLELRVLVRVHGDEEQFLGDRGDVLYNVRRAALGAVLAARRPPSCVLEEDPERRTRALLDEPVGDSSEARNRRLRLALTRRLLDDPVVYYAELTAEENAYLTSQRAHLCRAVELATGLVTEVRAEGIAMVDEGGELTDLGLPEEGTDGHVALLLAERLSQSARARPGAVVPRAELIAHVAELVEAHAAQWRKGVTEPGAEVDLTDATVRRLEALGLVRCTPEGVLPRPAIARYALAQPVRPGRTRRLV